MSLLRLYTGLPDHFFAIAGYGSFRPVTNNPLEPANRRVEIYLVPQLIPVEEGP
jgi:chemotaxis protein MotB